MEIRNYGIPGSTVRGILESEVLPALEFAPTAIVILAGTNDTCNPPSIHDTDSIAKDYDDLLNAVSKSGAKIFVFTIPPVIERAFLARHTPDEFKGMLPSKRIDEANEAIKTLADKYDATIIDIHSEFLKRDLEYVDSPLLNKNNFHCDDGCHPTCDGYSIMAWNVAKKIIESSTDISRIACIGDSITHGVYMKGAGTADGETYPAHLGRFLKSETKEAKTVSDELAKSIIYQLFLRSFTPEGTLSAAEKYLERVAETGSDIVYLCPFVTADTDVRHEFWSERQKKSACENAKSPYRLMDFFEVDPEYGTKDDLRSFVKKAHSLDLKVMFDLVYYHCGPTFAAKHPAFVKRNEDGTLKNGSWAFPEFDFSKDITREYLFANMEYFVKEFDCDGFRCDVGIRVPLDFWKEGVKRLKLLKSNIIMLCEGEAERALEDQLSVFDINYSFTWSTAIIETFRGLYPASTIGRKHIEQRNSVLRGMRFLRAIDSHDIANDVYEKRFEKEWGSSAVDAALVIAFTFDGIPFIYNGYEDNDTSRHSIFANRGEFVIDRSKAKPERMTLLKKLSSLRHTEKALFKGDFEYIENDAPDSIVSFRRDYKDESIYIFVNTTNKRHTFNIAKPLNGNILFEHVSNIDSAQITLESYGYLIIKHTKQEIY